MNLPRRLLLLILFAFYSLAAVAEMEIVTLKYRSAEQLIPVIRPLIAPGGTVSGMQNQLILRTTRANLKDLRKVLAGLDTLPRRLMISVRQDAQAANAQAGAELHGSAGSGGQGRQGVAARIYQSRGASGDRITQQLQVLEGNPAYIRVGQSIPVATQSLTRTVNGPVATDNVAYRDLATGFEVVPRVSGERVFLNISSRRETPVGSRGGAEVQRVVSSASGRLGEWFELGASIRNGAGSDADLLVAAAGMRKEKLRIWVKVEELK